MAPSLTCAEVCHIHHRNTDREIHRGHSLQLFIPFGHFLCRLCQPALQMFRFYRARYDLQDIFLVGHTCNIFLGRILCVGIDRLIAHSLTADIDTAVLSLRNTAKHGHFIHHIHFLRKPFQLIISQNTVFQYAVGTLQGACHGDKVVICNILCFFCRFRHTLHAV